MDQTWDDRLCRNVTGCDSVFCRLISATQLLRLASSETVEVWHRHSVLPVPGQATLILERENLMVRYWRCALTWPISILLSTLALPATVIDFDNLSDGDIVTLQFPGLAFANTQVLTAGISLNEFEFPPRSGSNVVSDLGGPITIEFTSPILSFTGYFTYTVPLTLTAYNEADRQVATATSAFLNNLACLAGPPCTGDPGSFPNELLQVGSSAGITRIVIKGALGGNSVVLDDVTFQAAITEVPEVGTGIAVQLGLLITLYMKYLSSKTMNQRKLVFVTICLVFGLGTAVILAQHRSTPPIPAGTEEQMQVLQTYNSHQATDSIARQLLEVSVSPSRLVQGSSVPLVVEVRIDDPGVIRSSVVLLQIAPSGQARPLSYLNDDGVSGDLVANDGRFTTNLSLANQSVGQVKLRISAAFRGTLSRTQSSDLSVEITPQLETGGWATLTDSQRLFSIQVPSGWNLRAEETYNPDSATIKDVDFQFPDGTSAFIISVHPIAGWTQLQASDSATPVFVGQTSQYVFGMSFNQDEYVTQNFSDSAIRLQLPQVAATFKPL
jgi:hypothetical protein